MAAFFLLPAASADQRQLYQPGFLAAPYASAAVAAAIGTSVQKRADAARASTPEMKAALLYSTTTGNTETAAGYIAAETGLTAVDIGDVDLDTLKECDSLIVGAPTWNTGADEERSGTAWDEFLYGDLTGL